MIRTSFILHAGRLDNNLFCFKVRDNALIFFYGCNGKHDELLYFANIISFFIFAGYQISQNVR